jgi:hypothetical protein
MSVKKELPVFKHSIMKSLHQAEPVRKQTAVELDPDLVEETKQVLEEKFQRPRVFLWELFDQAMRTFLIEHYQSQGKTWTGPKRQKKSKRN